MINLSVEQKLNIMTPSTNRALKKVLSELDSSTLQQFKESKDISTLLNTILKERTLSQKNNQELLKALQNNPTLKELSNSKKNFTTLERLITSFLNNSSDENEKIKAQLQLLLKKVSHYQENPKLTKNAQQLQSKIQQSGLFLESQIASSSTFKELVDEDLKALILKSKELLQESTFTNKNELIKQLDKISIQIDYYQLLSSISNSSTLYIPYAWDELQEGSIELKSTKKGAFFCDIELTLQNYGALKVRLGLFNERELNINIMTASNELQQLLKSGIKQLKKGLFTLNIHLKEIRFLEYKEKDSAYADDCEYMDMGFEVKV